MADEPWVKYGKSIGAPGPWNKYTDEELTAQGVPPTPRKFEPARVASQVVGGTIGSVLGAPLGLPGAIGGASLGAVAGEEGYQLLNRAHGIDETRDIGQRIIDDAWAAAGAGAGEAAGAVIGAGIRAGVKAVFRGGSKGQAKVQQNLQNFGIAGADPTVGEATQNYLWQSIESALGRTPGPHGQMIKRSEQTSERIRNFSSQRAEWMGGPELDPEYVGAVGKGGIENWRNRFTAEGALLEREFMRELPPATPSAATNYGASLEKFTSVDPAAPKMTGDLINPKLEAMLTSLNDDLASNGAVPVSALLQARSRIGESLSDFELISPVKRSQLKALYKSLSDDIRATMPEDSAALAAFDKRNAHWQQGMQRIDNFLDGMMKKGVEPEKLFDAIFRGTKGTTMIRELRGTLSQDEWRVVTGGILKRMGYRGGAEETWDSLRFLTQWRDMPDATKDALFGASGQSLFRRDLDMVTDALGVQKQMFERFGNPPKTAAGFIGGAMVGGAGAGAVAWGMGLSGSADFLVALAGMSAGLYGTAKYLFANPNFVHWLARSTKVTGGPTAVTNHIAKLGAIAATADQQTRDAIQDYLGIVRQAVAQDWVKQQQPPQPQPVPTGP
jgi:hypothetical protein